MTTIALLFHGNVAEPSLRHRAVLRTRMLEQKQLAFKNLADEISVEKDNTTYFTISSIYCLAQTDVSFVIFIFHRALAEIVSRLCVLKSLNGDSIWMP